MKQKLVIFIIILLVATSLFPWQENYILKPNDEIEVFVLGQPDLSKRFIIRPDGKITLPLIGEVDAAGKTITELTSELKRKLSLFLPINEVSVNLVSSNVVRVYVFGEVKNPGEYTFPQNEKVTLIKLLAKAGGPNSQASLKNIEIIKNNSEKVIKVNISKNYSKADMELENGDTVFVKKKKFVELSLIQTISWLIWTWMSIYIMSKGI